MNKKGFMLFETLVASTFILGTLIFLYIQFSSIQRSYDTSFKYNTVTGLYRAKELTTYLETDGYAMYDYTLSTDSTIGYIQINNCQQSRGPLCKRIIEKMEAKNVLFVGNNISVLKSNLATSNYDKSVFNEEFKRFILTLDTVEKQGRSRLIIEYNDNTFASVAIGISKADEEKVDFQVRHFLMNTDGKTYTLADTENLAWFNGYEYETRAKIYTGFKLISPETQVVIAKDSLNVDYYYERNKYNVSIEKGVNVTDTYGSGTYYYGATVNLSATPFVGYHNVWSGDYNTNTFTMPSKNVNIKVHAQANTNTKYTVKHYKMDLNGTYTLSPEVQVLTGTTDTVASPNVKTYEGFTSPSKKSVKILGDGSSVVEYYYTRNRYTVTLNKGMGISSVSGAKTYYYGENVTVNAILLSKTAQYSYGWSNWTGTYSSANQNYTFTMPANNVTLTANGTRTINRYSVVIRICNMDIYGNYPNSSWVWINTTADYGTVINYTGYNTGNVDFNEVNYSGTVTGNIDATVYASRKQYYLDLNGYLDGGDSSSIGGYGTADIYVNGSIVANDVSDFYQPIYYGASYNITDIKAFTGHTYNGVYSGSTSGTITAKTAARLNYSTNTYTIKYAKNGGSGSMSSTTCTYGKDCKLRTNAFTRTGYTFNGWTGSDGNSYSNKATVKNLTETNGGTVTMTAKWKAHKYTIKYAKNGGSGSMSSTTCTYGKDCTLRANAFTKTGYSFNGWTGSNGNSYSNKATVKNLTAIDGEAITMTAKWKNILQDADTNSSESNVIYGLVKKDYTLRDSGVGGSGDEGWDSSKSITLPAGQYILVTKTRFGSITGSGFVENKAVLKNYSSPTTVKITAGADTIAYYAIFKTNGITSIGTYKSAFKIGSTHNVEGYLNTLEVSTTLSKNKDYLIFSYEGSYMQYGSTKVNDKKITPGVASVVRYSEDVDFTSKWTFGGGEGGRNTFVTNFVIAVPIEY